jgi:hypothetical protein
VKIVDNIGRAGQPHFFAADRAARRLLPLKAATPFNRQHRGTAMNEGFCNCCRDLVPAVTREREGRIYLVKTCPKCGDTETLIASDARRYGDKHALDLGGPDKPCKLNCLACGRQNQPNIVFLDVTNRCNMNCPICINNTPSMGFLFEPPMEYFEKIFAHFSKLDPVPAFQLFGGEPTVRNDLIAIIKLAKSYGIACRVVTNGIKMADADYCEALVATRATILIAYDGADPATYAELRGSEKYLSLKQQAIENLGRQQRPKVVFMSLVGKGYNDNLADLLEYTHAHRRFVRGIYFMPLAHTWDTEEFDLTPERITSEDIETMVDGVFPDTRVDFIPAGFLGQVPTLRKALNVKPLPFVGAHPNCESMYILVSDGERYLPVSHYLKTSLLDICHALLKAETKLQRSATKETLLGSQALKRLSLSARALLAAGAVFRRKLHLGKFFRGRGPGKLYHMLGLPLSILFGARSKTALARHTTVQGTLQLIILPFEDAETLETERMKRCPAAFAFYDPERDRVGHVPVCAWGLHKNDLMKRVSEYYGTRKPVATTG